MSDEVKPVTEPAQVEDDVLDADVKEIEQKIKKDGVVKVYIIRELDGPGRKWWDKITQQAIVRNKKNEITGVNDPVGLQHKLIARTVIDKETGVAVTEEFVRTWGTSTQLTVFMKSRNLSGLDKEAEEAAKNA